MDEPKTTYAPYQWNELTPHGQAIRIGLNGGLEKAAKLAEGPWDKFENSNDLAAAIRSLKESTS